MNALIRTGRLAAPLICAVAAALAGCASNSTLMAHESAAPPSCDSGPPPLLGCANRANLRAMVADPADLDHGRAATPASGAREAAAVDAYKRDQVKPLSSSKSSTSTMITQP